MLRRFGINPAYLNLEPALFPVSAHSVALIEFGHDLVILVRLKILHQDLNETKTVVCMPLIGVEDFQT
jgi:hypothetical protein